MTELNIPSSVTNEELIRWVTDAVELWTTCASSIRAQGSEAVWQTTFVGALTRQIDNSTHIGAVQRLRGKERTEGG